MTRTAPRPRALVADDDPAMRSLLEEHLEEDGFDVSTASDGAALVGLLARTVQDEAARPDVVVTDERMPLRGGLDVVALLRGSGWRVPVVLITAFADAALRARAQALGALVVEKPFELARLTGAVRSALSAPPDQPVVLLADDDPVVRGLLARSLRAAGYAVVEAADGQEAIELGTRGARVDLLLTDLHMPRMDGDELASALCARRPGLKVLVLSGAAERADVGFPFESKPVSEDLLLRRVAQVLAGRR